MAATDKNDPKYANDPTHYVWVNDRWQYRDSSVDPSTAPSGRVEAESLGTQSVGELFDGLGRRITGRPMSDGDVSHQSSLPNAQHWTQVYAQGARRQQAVNPYNSAIADQSRAAQLALMQQMRAQQAGPSIANMQGQRAMGQMGQQALMQGGRGAMLGAQGGSAGLAGDVGQARLAEIMKSQGGIGGAAGALRGADLRSADAQMGAGMQAQTQADQSARLYAQMGSNMGVAQDRLGLEWLKFINAMKVRGAKVNEDTINGYLQTMASIAGK